MMPSSYYHMKRKKSVTLPLLFRCNLDKDFESRES
jgi:hypothetical protein